MAYSPRTARRQLTLIGNAVYQAYYRTAPTLLQAAGVFAAATNRVEYRRFHNKGRASERRK